MDLDRSLAFTALLERDPAFRTLAYPQGTQKVTRLLNDYRADGRPGNLWDYTPGWLERQASDA